MKHFRNQLTTLSATLLGLLAPAVVMAHGEDHPPEAVVEELGFVVTNPLYMWIAGVGSVVLVVLALAAFLLQEKSTEKMKKAFFIGLTATTVITTLLLVGFTIYQTVESETRGPVHWHADFRIYNCGQEVDLIDPTGLLNRVGTPELHEHGDNRLHVEGTMHRLQDTNFGSFFHEVGGELTETTFVVPTNNGDVVMNDGGTCPGPDGVDEEAELQVFLYKTEDTNLVMTKLEHPETHIPSPWSQVPPGDCLVFEYSAEPLLEPQGEICPFQQIELNDGNLTLVNEVKPSQQ